MTESLIVSLVGGGCGLVAGSFAVRVITDKLTAQTTRAASLSIDWRVALFTMLASVLTAVLFGLPVALQQDHRIENALSASTRTQTPGLRRMQAGLVVTQVALAFVLLAGSGLMLRTIEIGIRIALGAQPGDVLRLILAQGTAMIVGGLLVGLGTWLLLMRVMQRWLYGVTPADPMTLLAVALTLGLTAMAATYIGSRRCLRVDPVQVLRYD